MPHDNEFHPPAPRTTYVPAYRPAPPSELAAIAGGGPHGRGLSQPADLFQAAIPPYDGARETTNAQDRAIATTIRSGLLAGVLVLVGGLLLAVGTAPGLVIGAGILTLLAGLLLLTRLDYHYSAPGIAHHAIEASERLASEQVQLNHALRQQALDAYLQHLEGGRHDR